MPLWPAVTDKISVHQIPTEHPPREESVFFKRQERKLTEFCAGEALGQRVTTVPSTWTFSTSKWLSND